MYIYIHIYIYNCALASTVLGCPFPSMLRNLPVPDSVSYITHIMGTYGYILYLDVSCLI